MLLGLYDRLLKNKDIYLISAQVFRNGINRWILSQGEAIEIIKDNLNYREEHYANIYG